MLLISETGSAQFHKRDLLERQQGRYQNIIRAYQDSLTDVEFFLAMLEKGSADDIEVITDYLNIGP